MRTKEWGPASVSKTDIAGEGVRFDFTGLMNGQGTIVGDNFALNANAGGSGDFNGDFTAYDKYCLEFENIDATNGVSIVLKMNTGWTDTGWGQPENDTYWQSEWGDGWVGPGETKVIVLEFNDAEVYNAQDELYYTAHTDGTKHVTIYRLDQVSDIGFQVCSENDNQDTSIIVSKSPYGGPDPCIPEFSTIAIPAVAVLGLFLFFNKRKHKKE